MLKRRAVANKKVNHAKNYSSNPANFQMPQKINVNAPPLSRAHSSPAWVMFPVQSGAGDPTSAGALGAVTLRPSGGEGVSPPRPPPPPRSTPVPSSPRWDAGQARSWADCAPNLQGVPLAEVPATNQGGNPTRPPEAEDPAKGKEVPCLRHTQLPSPSWARLPCPGGQRL